MNPVWYLAWERLDEHQGLGKDQHHEHLPASMLQEVQLVVKVLVDDYILSVDQECLGYLVALEGTGDTL